jgi:hypothetical protein
MVFHGAGLSFIIKKRINICILQSLVKNSLKWLRFKNLNKKLLKSFTNFIIKLEYLRTLHLQFSFFLLLFIIFSLQVPVVASSGRTLGIIIPKLRVWIQPLPLASGENVAKKVYLSNKRGKNFAN